MFGRIKMELIVNESEITKVISAVQEVQKNNFNYKIGSCGWADEPYKWFISFKIYRWKYVRLLKKLNNIVNFVECLQ